MINNAPKRDTKHQNYMERLRMKQIHTHKVDLTEIEGNGDFKCPSCGAIISPDDTDEEAYTILGTKVSKDCLEELLVRCNRCQSHIHITGFSLLQEIEETDKGNTESNGKKGSDYFYHV